jgi:SAM-dependent methyltransferase
LLYNGIMIHILFGLFYWLIFLILLSVLILLFIWMWGNIRAKVPFVGVPNRTLKDIEKALLLKEDSVVYDLGCGDGRVLFYLSKNNPKIKYIGIENSMFPFILASVENWWHKKIDKLDNVKIIKADFFKIDLSNATHIFTYLYPNVMDDLLPKFDKEIKEGTRLVSASFHFTNKIEINEIDLKRGKYKLAKKIYVYEF